MYFKTNCKIYTPHVPVPAAKVKDKLIIWFNKVVQVYINLNDPSPGSEKRKLLLKLLYNYASKTHRSAKNGVPNFRTVAQCLLQ